MLDFKHASFVMKEIRRSNLEIDEKPFSHCIGAAKLKIATSRSSISISDERMHGADTVTGYKFLDKTISPNSYLICKLYTNLYNKTFGHENKNSFEFYMQICQLVDADPENADFLMNSDLRNFTNLHGNEQPTSGRFTVYAKI